MYLGLFSSKQTGTDLGMCTYHRDRYGIAIAIALTMYLLALRDHRPLLSTPKKTHCIFFQTSPDGNVTLSTLNYVPSVRDAGKFMACRAENPEVPDATLEDGWKVEIHCKKPFFWL